MRTWALTGPMTSPLSMAVATSTLGDDFSPLNLFKANEQGFWYDPSDLSTLYQDHLGTTPVTAVGQFVGMVLDKRLGLVRGSEKVDYSTGAIGSSYIIRGTSVAQGGGYYKITTDAAGEAIGYGVTVASPDSFMADASKWYMITIDVIGYQHASGAALQFRMGLGQNLGTLWPFLSFTGVGSKSAILQGGSYDTITAVHGSVASTVVGDFATFKISVRELPGNHATQSAGTSKMLLQQDGGGRYYFNDDGVDDFLVTNSIDFSGTDKVTLFAGVRKTNDSGSIVVESSSNVQSNIGSFYLVSGTDLGGTGYSSMSRGTATANTNQVAKAFTYAGADTAVLTCSHDIAGDLSRIRRNGVLGLDGTADKGAGNFGNYPVYIGRRNGTSIPFTGRIYGLICRGAATDLADIEKTEAWLNAKTGAY